MIALEDVTKVLWIGQRKLVVLSPTNIEIPSDRRIALLGASESDKRVVIDLLAGITLPTEGLIRRNVTVSFPVGYSGGFTGDLSVRKNIEYLARLYGADLKSVCGFVESMIDLGEAYEKPFMELAIEQRNKLSQVLTYAIPFDVYVLYGDLNRGPKNFRATLEALYRARACEAGMIMSTSNMRLAREYCDMAIVLRQGQLVAFNDIEDAIEVYRELTSDDGAQLIK